MDCGVKPVVAISEYENFISYHIKLFIKIDHIATITITHYARLYF